MVILDGINYISDIELDSKNKKIYLVSGSLSSELYQLDYKFNKLPLTQTCNIDFLKFPTKAYVLATSIKTLPFVENPGKPSAYFPPIKLGVIFNASFRKP